MKLTISQPALIDIISIVSKAVATRTPKPVLTGILLEASTGQLTATAYDLELGIQSTITSDDDNRLDVEDAGNIVLPARYFSDVVKKLPADLVTIQVEANYMTLIQSGKAQFHLHGIDADEFPRLPSFDQSRSLNLASDLLNELITSTVFATSTLEARPILTGVNLEFRDQLLTATATDALRLARKQTTVENSEGVEEWSAVIPGKSFGELAKLLPPGSDPITVQFTTSHSLFEIGSTLFYSRLIDGNYPDTERIIPSGHKTEVAFDLSSLRGAIDRASLIARDREVRLEVADDTVVIASNSPEIGNLSETIDIISKQGDNLTISFNAKYVLDALRAMDMDVVHVYFNGWNQPFVMRQEGDDFGLQLISPVLMR